VVDETDEGMVKGNIPMTYGTPRHQRCYKSGRMHPWPCD